MKLLDELYYQFYLFYTKHIVDDEPYALSAFALGVEFSMIVNCLANWLMVYTRGSYIQLRFSLMIYCLLIGISFYIFLKGRRGKKIASERKVKGKTRNKYRIISIMFFLIAVLMLLFGANVSQWILEMR